MLSIAIIMNHSNILIVEDDIAFCNMLQTFLSKKGFEVQVAYNFSNAMAILSNTKFDVVLTDVRLPENEGTEILSKIKAQNIDTKVILMTGYAEVNKAVDAIRDGAFDYISKPISPDSLLKIIYKATSHQPDKSAQSKNTAIVEKEQNTPTGSDKMYIEGISDESAKLNHYINLVAPTTMSVLIVGNSGTGKEYIAQTIHGKSKRSDKPFIPVDCGTIPRELASSEFFGHVKGSFTGAISNKTGHFEIANGGTLFLDEIGNLSYELQVQLLRAIQERKIKPVGSNKEIGVDIRIIAATNENLADAVKKGKFREDLYHRLNEFTIKAPLLSERKEDILLFANYFLQKSNTELEKNILGFSEEVSQKITTYHWPGNLREMQNAIKRAVLLCQEEYIQLLHLPIEVINDSHEDEVPVRSLFQNKFEKNLILEALQKAEGNKSKAAKILNIDRKTLYNKLTFYNIKY